MPIYPKLEDIVYTQGIYFTAEWYYTSNGHLPALEYYIEMPEVDQNRLDYMVKYLCDNSHGTVLPKTMYRIEDRENKIYVFKPRNERFFNFMAVGAKIIVTNAYHKHSQMMTKQDMEHLKTSIRFRSDYFRRIREGTYYEK